MSFTNVESTSEFFDSKGIQTEYYRNYELKKLDWTRSTSYWGDSSDNPNACTVYKTAFYVKSLHEVFHNYKNLGEK